MTAVTPEVITSDDAGARYQALRDMIGDVAGFKRRAESYELDAQDRALYDALVELEYLLGL